MSAAWAAAAASAATAAAAAAAALWRTGRTAGRLQAVLERLAAITADHETRLRAVERYGHVGAAQRQRGARRG